jgi:hypothetical protein
MRYALLSCFPIKTCSNSVKPSPDSLLINGAGKFLCSRALPARPVKCLNKWRDKTPGLFEELLMYKPIRLRVVNVG